MSLGITDDRHYQNIADSVRYSKDVDGNLETYTPSELETEVQNLAVNYRSAVHELGEAQTEIAQNNEYFDDISDAIVDKDGGSPPEREDMADRIEAIPIADPPVQNPALILMDWEGTALKEYTKEQALALTELPNPNTLSKYTNVDHSLLTLQGWSWNLPDIKNWILTNKFHKLTVTAIYNPSDNQDHNFWDSSRLEGTATAISIQKRANTTLGYGTFNNCNLLKKISVPYGITTIGTIAFQNCSELQKVGLPNGITRLEQYAFNQCNVLETISLPNSITTIDGSAFGKAYKLKEIALPNNITTISNLAFTGCHNLSKINIPTSVQVLSVGLFFGCYGLINICVPQNVNTISSNAFYECRNLIDVVIKGKPELLNVNAFSWINANALYYVSEDDLSWFETATNWSTFYAQNKIVTIEDNITYLESIGIDVDEYKEVS